MNHPVLRYLAFAFALLIVGLSIFPAFTTAQGNAPPIPHTLERRDKCLNCHETGKLGAPQIPEGPPHASATNDVCRDCHEHVMPPHIPHTLEGRENCQKCHKPAEEGAETGETAAATEEAGPTPTPTTEPLPTPIAYPKVEGVNTCLDCHLTLEDDNLSKMAKDWQQSIHAEREVACVDCHGGDSSATTKEAAKAPETGYIGAPAKADIPALCASCHANVVLMRQYNLPTDQYAKYQESIHGLRLAEGDQNVATCFDCHGGHLVLKTNDPASTVYPVNIPDTCANCHADKELMAQYNIPTNEFALYQESVHGQALLKKQDFRAPSCATCHGTHGAAPPGFEEVANVCGSCHSATQEHYLKSPHAGGNEAAPKCVTCHENHDVTEPSEALYLGAEPQHCGECHDPDTEPREVAQELHDTLTGASQSYDEAEAAIESVREVGMLVAPMEARLREANTNLVTARAAQHTLDLDTVRLRTTKVLSTTNEVKATAEAAIAANIFRRRAMVIAVAAIILTIVALYLLKRELDRQLEEKEM